MKKLSFADDVNDYDTFKILIGNGNNVDMNIVPTFLNVSVEE